MPDPKWSPYENGMPGLHLIINPQKPLPPEARINRQFINHHLTSSDKELESLLRGRNEGIATLDTLMGKLMPGLGRDTRLRFSTQIADALFDKSLSAQLSREAPTVQDQLQARDEVLKQVFEQALPPGARRAPAPTLLEQVPVGFSLTITSDRVLRPVSQIIKLILQIKKFHATSLSRSSVPDLYHSPWRACIQLVAH